MHQFLTLIELIRCWLSICSAVYGSEAFDNPPIRPRNPVWSFYLRYKGLRFVFEVKGVTAICWGTVSAACPQLNNFFVWEDRIGRVLLLARDGVEVSVVRGAATGLVVELLFVWQSMIGRPRILLSSKKRNSMCWSHHALEKLLTANIKRGCGTKVHIHAQ